MTIFEKHKKWREIRSNLKEDASTAHARLEEANSAAVNAANAGDKDAYTTACFEREQALAAVQSLGQMEKPYRVTREEATAAWQEELQGITRGMVKAAENILKARKKYQEAIHVARELEEVAQVKRYDYLSLMRDYGISGFDSVLCEDVPNFAWSNILKMKDERVSTVSFLSGDMKADGDPVQELEDILPGCME